MNEPIENSMDYKLLVGAGYKKRADALVAQAESRVREELKEKAAKMRLEPTLCGNCNLNGPLCKECYANRRANKMLDDVLALLSLKEE